MKRRPWWHLAGPGEARPAREVFRWSRVWGGRARTVRRLFRLGPFGVLVIRYGPDQERPPLP